MSFEEEASSDANQLKPAKRFNRVGCAAAISALILVCSFRDREVREKALSILGIGTYNYELASSNGGYNYIHYLAADRKAPLKKRLKAVRDIGNWNSLEIACACIRILYDEKEPMELRLEALFSLDRIQSRYVEGNFKDGLGEAWKSKKDANYETDFLSKNIKGALENPELAERLKQCAIESRRFPEFLKVWRKHMGNRRKLEKGFKKTDVYEGVERCRYRRVRGNKPESQVIFGKRQIRMIRM